MKKRIKLQAEKQNDGQVSNLFEEHERIATFCVCCGSKNLRSAPAILMPFVAHRAFGWKPVVIDDSWGLNTIRNGYAYSICNSLHCQNCGFLFLDIRFSDAELSNLYDDYRGNDYNSLRKFYEPDYELRNDNLNAGIGYVEEIERFLERYLSFPLTILDWGGDTGKNTPFKNSNLALDIYDISNKAVVPEAQLVTKHLAQSKKYGLIVCSNVLEHVPYPAELLLDLKQSMNLDSVLYIEVPLENIVLNNNSKLHTLKKHWHEHINFYSEKSLRMLVKNIGLQVVGFNILEATAGGRSSFIYQMACKLQLNP